MNLRLRIFLRDVARGEMGPAIAARAQEFLDGPAESRSIPPRHPKQLGAAYAHAEARRAREEAQEDAAKHEMHDAVWATNMLLTSGWGAPFGRCDCGCGGAFMSKADGECDHWVERSQGPDHRPENGWRLLGKCHRAKTNNRPDRAAWNEKRRAYCGRVGIPLVERRTRYSPNHQQEKSPCPSRP